MSEREDLGFQLLLLTRLFEDEPDRNLKPKCFILIDQVANYASQRHRGLPQPIAETLAGATHAAMRADVGKVIEQVEAALTEADRPAPRKTPANTVENAVAPQRKPRPAETATAKPIKQTTDKLLAALRRNRSTSK